MSLNASADFGPIDPRHVLDALHAIDPSCPRDEWHRIGRAAIAAGLSVEDVIRWSEPAANYSGERDTRAAFRSIKRDGGTTAATLWRAALDAGWRPPQADAKPAGMGSPGRQQKARHGPKKGPGGASAAEVWARCKPATDGHPYIVAKQGRPDGLRVVLEGDGLRIAGASVARWLVVPVLPLAGAEPVSLQFIPPPGAGKKLNLPGASVAGVFTVGELAPGGTAYLCEGIGQAWACWKATGAAAVVCFGWGRVRAVAAELRQRDESARLVLVPDVGKEADAERIAREVGAAVAEMPEGWPLNADVNDYAQREGADALEALLSRASEPPKPPSEFDGWPDGSIAGLLDAAPPPRAWFCEQRLLAGRGHLIVGVGGSSKTRALYHLAVGAVLGVLPWAWEVRRTGPAALFLAEDTAADVHHALHALGQRLNTEQRQRLAAGLRVFPLAGRHPVLLELQGQALRLTAAYGWLMEQLDALPGLAFVGLDPALALTEGDELHAAHQRRFGELVDRIGIDTGACTVATAHAAKSIHAADELGSHSARGSGAVTDAVRGEFTLRGMTADEARRYGIGDLSERKALVQLAGTKGNHLPPDAFVPVWLRRGPGGVLEQVELELARATAAGPGDRDLRALELLRHLAPRGDVTLRDWRGQCIDAGIIPRQATPPAQEKAMERIRDALRGAAMVGPGAVRGTWVAL